MNDDSRTLVLGFDALDFKYLDAFADDLPAFTALRMDGVEAPLHSTFPPWTPSAWPSMYTGTDPSHHGVYDFFTYDYPDDGRIVSRNDVKTPALWNYLSAKEIPSVVVNLPVTHPSEPMEGALIPGYLAAEEDAYQPEELRHELAEALGEPYYIYSRTERGDDSVGKLDGYVELMDLRRRAAVELLTNRDWQLGIIQVQKTDTVFHNLEEEAAHRRVYRAADRLLADVLETVDDDVNVIVCSDHGMGTKDGYQIYLNEVLRRHGYLQATRNGDRVTMVEEKRRMTGTEDDEPDLETRALSQALSALRRVGVSPSSLYGVAERLGVEEQVMRFIPDSARRAASETVDWRDSVAYCRAATRLGVRINLEGREPNGIVPPDEYEQVRTDLISLLEELETPDGEPAFDMVVPREAVYSGPRVDDAPDVLVHPAGMNHALSTKLYGREFVPIDIYDHEEQGAFIAAGPDVGEVPDLLSLTDVAPMAMALMGLPVPDRMTGQVPDGFLGEPPRIESYGDVPFGTENDGVRDDDAVTERLEDLGYL